MRLPWTRFSREPLIVFLSLLLQVPLAVFLGHYYDERVFMATGYLVSSGLNPYQPYLFTGVFSNPLLTGVIPSIGYPPPWPLLLGIIFRLSFNVIPNLFLYNFAIKVPVIVGNIGLAYLVRNLIMKFQANKRHAQVAWLFILFNPFILLSTTAWGQFDTVVALFCVASLYLLSKGMVKESALILAVGVAIKPIALPLVGLPFLSSVTNSPRKNLQYLLVFCISFFTLYFAPFFLLGWSVPLASNEWNAHLVMAGGMSPFNILELVQNSPSIPQALGFLGYLWLPALLVGYYAVYRNRPTLMNELVEKAIGVTLIFFLTRSWLSEPNVNLVLPLMLLAIKPKEMSFRNFHFAWMIPLVFMFLNFAFPQLFFLVYPSIIGSLTVLDQQIRNVRLIARFLVVIPWQILSWKVVIKVLRRNADK